MLASRNILVVDGIAILVFRQLLLGVSIGQPRTKAVVPLCLSTYLATTHAIVVEVGVWQVGQPVGSRLEVRRRCGKLVLHLVVIY